MIFGLLIPLFFILILIVVARRLFAKDSGNAPSTFSIRRLFQYLLLFGLLIVSATGTSGLIGRLFDSGQVIAESRSDLARDLTFVIIGIPLFVAVSLWTRRTLNNDPSEPHSAAWNTYLTVTSITALVTSMTSAYSVLNWAIGNAPFSGQQLSSFLVWGLVWITHWQLIQSNSTEDDARIHYVIGSLIGLGTLSFGLGGLISSIARVGIDVDEKALLVQSTNPTIKFLILIIVGLPVWYQYWLVKALNAARELIWYSYVLLIGVAGGFITLVVSSSIVIYDFLVWTVGDPQEELASRHFDSSAAAVGGVVAGLAVWWYHGRVVNTVKLSSVKSRDEIRRVYEYIVSGISLISAAAGLMMIIVAVLESITPGEIVSTTSSSNTLMIAFTLIIVGAPIWYFFWSRIEAHVVTGGEEISSPTRRIFLLMLFGVATVAAVISLLTAVFIFLDNLLNNQLGMETLREMRFALAILLSNAGIGWYHWSIYRQERSVDVRKSEQERFIVLVGPKDKELVALLRQEFGGQVQMWRALQNGSGLDGNIKADQESSREMDGQWDRQKVLDLLKVTDSPEIMIVKEKRGLKAIPISRRS
jgi:hypothetical protein